MKKIYLLFSLVLAFHLSRAQSRVALTDSLVQVVEKHFNAPNLEGTFFTPELIEFIYQKKGQVILSTEEYKLLMDEFYQRRKPGKE